MAPSPDPTLALPRILCLHGGGVTASIFRAQARALIAQLNPYFRLVFADGPFLCAAGPGIASVYADHGPFRRWLRWLPEHPPIDAESAIAEIDYTIETAMRDDDALGATGPYVAVLGFSQGAKIAASLLYRQQLREEHGLASPASGFRFAVLMAGRAPLVAFDAELVRSPAVIDAAQICEGFTSFPAHWDPAVLQRGDHLLRRPTVHVHGLLDPGLPLHRGLLDLYCETGTTRLVEWQGAHRLPIKRLDVEPVVEQILAVARETGVLET